MSEIVDLSELKQFLREFAKERDWEQFHTPKNLVMALSGEVGELAELFQWLDNAQAERIMEDPQKASAVEGELADVFQYLIRISDVLGVDLSRAVWEKIRSNADRYPVEKAKGNARKHTEL